MRSSIIVPAVACALIMWPVGPSQAQVMSTICGLTHGAFAGKYFDFSPKPPLPVDSVCSDQYGNVGVVVAPPPMPAAPVAARPAAPPPPPKVEMSTLCQFTAGAKKGTVRDYAPMAAIPVGVPCFDGQGSTGVVISAKR